MGTCHSLSGALSGAPFAIRVSEGRVQAPVLTHPPFSHLLQFLDFLLDLLGLGEVTQEVEIVFIVGPVDLWGVSDAQSLQKLLVCDVTPSINVIALKNNNNNNKNDSAISSVEGGLVLRGQGHTSNSGDVFFLVRFNEAIRLLMSLPCL